MKKKSDMKNKGFEHPGTQNSKSKVAAFSAVVLTQSTSVLVRFGLSMLRSAEIQIPVPVYEGS